MKRNTWIGIGVGVALVAGGTAYVLTRPKEEIKWRQAKVERGNVTQRINATGAVSPVVQVAVGTQVSGVISALYVDYNSIVKKDQLIAQIEQALALFLDECGAVIAIAGGGGRGGPAEGQAAG